MRRFAPIVAVLVIAVIVFIAVQPGDDEQKSSSPVQIRVEGGKPAGGIKSITVKKGDQVRFAVTSDVADEIHVHGYDFMKDVKAGGKVTFDFPAKIDGEFEIELENHGEQIAKLRVNP
jgi:heme/copper-type cytochrome/quinol oxidase subunit 2